MNHGAVPRLFWSFVCFLGVSATVLGQGAAAVSPAVNGDGASVPKAELQFVVVLSRHGVRSPIVQGNAIEKYAAAPWPKWDVPPSYLTPHGFEAVKLFGIWDRTSLAEKGLFAATGCDDAATRDDSCGHG